MESNKYYQLLKENYTSKEEILSEIINLEAILHLPKGTEHFLSDIHGEFNAFDHILRNGSGSVKEKLIECFENQEVDIDELSHLIYYPEEFLAYKKTRLKFEDLEGWYKQIIRYLIQMTNFSSKKYTRSKLRKTLPERFQYILDELLREINDKEKEDYFNSIVQKVINLNQADGLITDLSYTIQRLVVDHLHVVGDIYDRGPKPDLIMDRLMDYHSVDIQWGNHDMVWMAAMAGSKISMINLIRICARYGNLDTLEDSYGVNIRPLIEYANKYYNPLKSFEAKLDGESFFTERELENLNRVQQACAILQFKLEGLLIERRPAFKMQARNLLSKVNFKNNTLEINGDIYKLKDFSCPTVDKNNPIKLSNEETKLLEKLMTSIQSSKILESHMDFLFEKGSMYLAYNGNLLIHGCIPMHENGDFKSFSIDGKHYSGKELLDFFEEQVRSSYRQKGIDEDLATDLMWYLWTGECSSLFGKDAMTTFERYYIEDKRTHEEIKNSYYKLRQDKKICEYILETFGLEKSGHIINGHTPVKEKDGENPIKADGKMLVIDGGFSKPYQKQTGIAGYTLLANSYGLQLVAHGPFNKDKKQKYLEDIISSKRLVEKVATRTRVKNTNIGRRLSEEKADLEYLFLNY